MTRSSSACLTRVQALRSQISLLATVDPGPTPVFSCYLDTSRGIGSWEQDLNQRLGVLRPELRRSLRSDFEPVLSRLEHRIADGLDPRTQGIAVFARGDEGGSFFASMQFAVPMPNHLVVHRTPDILPLVEVMNAYDRYLLALVEPKGIEIQEVNMGVPSIRAQGSVLTQDCGRIGLQRQTQLVERLSISGGHTRLILAGHPELASELRALLPRPLQYRVVDVLPLPRRFQRQELLAASMNSFLEFKAQQSRNTAHRLLFGLRTRGDAVTGVDASLRALREGMADTLVIGKTPESETGWTNDRARLECLTSPQPAFYPLRKEGTGQPWDFRLELVRIATAQRVAVISVESDELLNRGGVGCLLRQRAECFAEPLPKHREELALVA